MDIKRISEHTVRCTISQEELQDYGVSMGDFVNQSDKGRQFIEYIINEAREQVGFEMTSGSLATQLMVTKGGIIITLSEMDEDGGLGSVLSGIMEEIAGTLKEQETEDKNKDAGSEVSSSDLDLLSSFLKKRLSELDLLSEEESSQEILDETQSSEISSDLVNSDEIQDKDDSIDHNIENNIEEAKSNSSVSHGTKCRQKSSEDKLPALFIWKFSDLSVVEQFCQGLTSVSQVSSSLYKDSEGQYLLILEAEGSDTKDLEYICANAMEFATLDSAKRERKQWLEEHSDCLIRRNAIPILAQL
ncbi:MAG: adaptor protein MecA [Lachnospiraceae bacterium]